MKENNSINDIQLSNRKAKHDTNQFREINLNKKKNKKIKKFILLVILFLIIGALISYFAHSVTFKIKDLEKTISLNNEIYKANVENPKQNEEIPFKILSANLTFSEDLKSEMVEEVEEKATGKIKIINTTSKVQRLRKETRFEVDGKIFKIYKTAIIPAKSSVIKEAFADEAGKEYNLKKGLKMTIPGFKEAKDMDSYKKITGEIAEDFSGGFIGKKDIPDKKDLERKKEEINEKIKANVDVKVRESLPEGYLSNTDGVFKNTKFKVVKSNDGLKLVSNTEIKAIIFDKKKLLALIVGLPEIKVKQFKIISTPFLKFKTFDKEKINIDSLKKFNFSLNGEITYNRTFNKDEFIDLVKGKKESEVLEKIKDEYPNFKIEILMMPFWMWTIPNDVDRIKIELEKK